MKKLYLILTSFSPLVDCFPAKLCKVNIDTEKQKNALLFFLRKIQFQKSYILLILIGCIYSNLFSQYTYKLPSNWRQSVYFHGNYYNSPPDSPLPVEYVGDTVLCSKTYNKINELSFFWNPSRKTKYIRIDSGKYFELREPNSCKEVLLYDFTLNEQDTFSPFKLNGNYVNSWIYSVEYVVDSVATVMYLESLERKWMRLKSIDGINRLYIYWVEGIGDIEMGFFPDGDFEGGRTSLICHREEDKLVWETSVNNHFESCEDLIDLLDSNKKTCLTSHSNKSNKNRNNNWYFGQNAAVDFNGEVPLALTNSAMLADDDCASISDASGELLFYTNGKTIWDKNHQPMLNGEDISPSNSSFHSVIIIPQPDNESVYYVFTTYLFGNSNNSSNSLYFSKVNMRLNGGLGAVEYSSKNKLILSDVINKITATYNANCKDIWIVVHGLGNSTFYSYRLSKFGLEYTPVISNIGFINGWSFSNEQLKFSPNGKKLANCIRYGTNYGVQLFDFDNQTGIISNPITIRHNRLRPYSCEFSPNSQYLYTTGNDHRQRPLYVYDIKSNDSLAIHQSIELITLDYGGYLQLATNGKIYIASSFHSSYLGAINKPDERGLDNNHNEKEIYLEGKSNYSKLPNFLYPNQCTGKPDYTIHVGCMNENTFFNLIGNACIDSLKWVFGNGHYSEVQTTDSFKYTYASSGNFLTQMIYWKNGRSDTLGKNIIIPELYNELQTFNICKGDTLFIGESYYTTSGNFADTFQSIFSCDSIVKTIINIIEIDSLFQHVEICPTDTFYQGLNGYFEAGIYSDKYNSSLGCDSVVITALSITTPTVSTNIYNECEGFTVKQGTNMYSISGVYKDVVNSCDTVITDLTIYPNPEFSYLKSNDNCQKGKGKIAIINIIGTSPFAYSWNTGAIDSVIFDLYKGIYSVSVIDSNDCSSTDTAELFDFENGCELYLYVPNAFSPNGDGVNDVFKVSAHNVNYFNMRIYNRWGEQIFISNNPEMGWDGTYYEKPCQTGVYTLTIEYNDGSYSKNLKYKGNVNLIR